MRKLDYRESWVLKNWCFWTVVLEKTLESPLNCKEIQPVHPKGYQSWVFIGRTDVEAEAPILWLPDARSRITGKDPDVGQDWRQEEKGTTDSRERWRKGEAWCAAVHGVTKRRDTTERLNNKQQQECMQIRSQIWTVQKPLSDDFKQLSSDHMYTNSDISLDYTG